MSLNFDRYQIKATGEPVAKISVTFGIRREHLVYAAASLIAGSTRDARVAAAYMTKGEIEAEIRLLVSLYGSAFLDCPSDYVDTDGGTVDDYVWDAAEWAVRDKFPALTPDAGEYRTEVMPRTS